jgi:anti-sigma regulatory factor (Ser/Thr protein kinase)
MEAGRMIDLRFAVSELVANALQHAGLGPGDPIHLSGTVGDRSVSVTVRDDGVGFTHTPRPGGGQGLMVVTVISVRLEVGAGWVTVEVARAEG